MPENHPNSQYHIPSHAEVASDTTSRSHLDVLSANAIRESSTSHIQPEQESAHRDIHQVGMELKRIRDSVKKAD